MTRHHRDLMRMFQEAGCEARLLRQRSGHLVYQVERDGRSSRLVAPQTPSDHRALRNLRATLERTLREAAV